MSRKWQDFVLVVSLSALTSLLVSLRAGRRLRRELEWYVEGAVNAQRGRDGHGKTTPGQ